MHSFPFLIRLDASLTEQWRYIQRQGVQPGFNIVNSRAYELADGSLLAVISTGALHLLRLSATGVPLATYPIVSQLPPATRPAQITDALPVLRDSTFVLQGYGFQGQSQYLGRIRIPGLPRVLPLPPIPAAVPTATRAPAPWPGQPAYPNPAATTLTVPYRRPPGTRALTLRVSDALGRAVLAQPLAPAPEGAAELDVRAWPPGLYLLTLEADGRPLARQRVAVGQ